MSTSTDTPGKAKNKKKEDDFPIDIRTESMNSRVTNKTHSLEQEGPMGDFVLQTLLVPQLRLVSVLKNILRSTISPSGISLRLASPCLPSGRMPLLQTTGTTGNRTRGWLCPSRSTPIHLSSLTGDICQHGAPQSWNDKVIRCSSCFHHGQTFRA